MGWPAGTCTGDCAVDPCAPGIECIAQTDGDHRCYAPCMDYLDCRPGYACFDYWGSGTSYCYPLCGDDNDCPDTGTCNPFTRRCGTPQTGGDYGTPCTVGTDCLGGSCFSSWPDGYCTSLCSLTNGECPTGSGAVCVDAALGTRGDLGACVVSCTNPSDCPRSGYTCSDLYLSPENVCAPQ